MNKKNNKSYVILSFYNFIKISKPKEIAERVLLAAKKEKIKGTVIFAEEGFNGSISSTQEKCLYLIQVLKDLTGPGNFNIKINCCNYLEPFSKIKVRIKKEIVSIKIDGLSVKKSEANYITTDEWDEFIQKEDVLVLDVRNKYEIKAGSFKEAVNPEIENFRDFPNWVQNNAQILREKRVAMFCTGGIRCEKSVAYMKALGYNQVYQLEGGILQYLQDTKNKNALWQGNCFVFDNRGAVGIDLLPNPGYWVEKGQTAKSVSKNK